MSETNELRFKVTGMKCAGCEAGAKGAVSKLPGYEDSVFDHKTESGVVKGAVDPDAVIAALAGVGYTASLVGS